jgi:superfamily II DNA or RNA helicase
MRYNTFNDFLNTLREHQISAFNEIQKHFIGQVFIPTGTGKTWIQKAVHVNDMLLKTSQNQTGVYVIGAHRLLLCEQLLDEIVELANNFNIKFRIMFVGSLDYNPKIINESMASTREQDIKTFIQSSQTNKHHTIIAATYHSFNLLKNIPIDICTFDEAHNTVSDDEDPKMFRRNIEEVKPFIRRQYFFTATPKAIGDAGGQKDQKFYGPILYELAPKSAVERLEIVQPKLHTVDIIGQFHETDINHNNRLFIKTVTETFIEHEKVLRVSAKLLVTGKNLDQVHDIYNDNHFQQWCKSNNILCFLFSSRQSERCIVDFDSSINYEEKLNQLKLDLNQRAIFFHYDILSEGMDIPNMTGCLFFRNLETNEIKFIQNIGRCSRLVLEDRRRIYNGEIKEFNDSKMKKPESWIIIPLYSSGESTARYKNILRRLRDTYNIPFIDVKMSRFVAGNEERITISINEAIDDTKQKDFVLKHDFEATLIELIKEELQYQLDQASDKEELVSQWIEEVNEFDNIFIEGLKSRLEEFEYFTRDPNARLKCLKHWGYSCYICGKNLEDVYGEAGKNKIEVHHEKQICEGYRVTDPIEDLKPVCPDCHTIIHSKIPCYDLIEVSEMLGIIELKEITE